MSRARQLTLLALALLVAGFVATWLTLPNRSDEAVNPPASLFLSGLTTSTKEPTCIGGGCAGRPPRFVTVHRVDVDALERRVEVVYVGAAAFVILVGLALGAGRREPRAG